MPKRTLLAALLVASLSTTTVFGAAVEYCLQELAVIKWNQLRQHTKWKRRSWQHGTPPAFLTPQPADPAAWKKMNVRQPDQVDVSPIYLQNLYDSVLDDFDPWYRNGDDQDYLAMLRYQHRTLTLGRDGLSPYLGATLWHRQKKDLSMILPGTFRSDVDPPKSEMKYPIDLKDQPNFFDLLPTGVKLRYQRYLEKHRDRYDLTKSPPEFTGYAGTQPMDGLYTLRIDGIDPNFLPVVWFDPRRFRLYYPKPPVLKAHYLPRLHKLMVEIRRKQRLGVKLKVLQIELKDYLQMASVSHPFRAVNMSLFFSHVNYVLQLYGHPGISHGLLDYLAMVSSTVQFHSLVDFKKLSIRP